MTDPIRSAFRLPEIVATASGDVETIVLTATLAPISPETALLLDQARDYTASVEARLDVGLDRVLAVIDGSDIALTEVRLDALELDRSAANDDRADLRSLVASEVAKAEPAFAKASGFNRAFGTGSDTVCQGNDARLSNARAPTAHTHAASAITSGTLANARIAAASVTQHQAGLSITRSQIPDFGAYATPAQGAKADTALQPGTAASTYVALTGTQDIAGTKRFTGALSTDSFGAAAADFVFATAPIRLSAGAVSAVVNPSDLINKGYVDTGLATKLSLAGGTVTGTVVAPRFEIPNVSPSGTSVSVSGNIQDVGGGLALVRYVEGTFSTQLVLRDDEVVVNRQLKFSRNTASGDDALSFTTKGFVDAGLNEKLNQAGGALGGSLTIYPTGGGAGSSYLTMRDSGLIQGHVIGTNTRVLLRRPVAGVDNDLSMYDAHSSFNKPVHGVDSTDTRSFTTKNYVDGQLADQASDAHITYASIDQPRFTGDLFLEDPATAQLVVKSGGSTAQLILRLGGDTTAGEVWALATRMLLRHKHSGAGTDTNINLWDDYIDVSKNIRLTGTAVADSTHPDDLINKGYVDTGLDGKLGLTGGTLTQGLTAPTFSVPNADAGGSTITTAGRVQGSDGALELIRFVAGTFSTSLAIRDDGVSVNRPLTLTRNTLATDPELSFTTRGYVDAVRRYAGVSTTAGGPLSSASLHQYVRTSGNLSLFVPPADEVGARIDLFNTGEASVAVFSNGAGATLSNSVRKNIEAGGDATLVCVSSNGTDTALWDLVGGSA